MLQASVMKKCFFFCNPAAAQKTHTHILSFFPQTVSTASELRKPIYWIVAAKAIDYEQMLLLMAGVKWDIREIMSQHNVYVDVLLKVMLHKERVGDCLCNVCCAVA